LTDEVGVATFFPYVTTNASALTAALNDLRTAHLLLLANHGELTNLAAAQVRDVLDLDLGARDGLLAPTTDDGSRTLACNGRFLEAQTLLRGALKKLGANDKDDLRSLTLPSALLDQLGGLFDEIVLTQEAMNVDANRQLALRVERLYDAFRAASATVPPLPSITATPEAAT
jgi:hypothetical protein